MRIFEIADAEAQLALWKLVNDSVWTAIQTQQHEQAKQKAAAQQQKKTKRSKRVSKRSISAPAPIPKLPNPKPNKPIANSPQQPAQKLPTPHIRKTQPPAIPTQTITNSNRHPQSKRQQPNYSRSRANQPYATTASASIASTKCVIGAKEACFTQ